MLGSFAWDARGFIQKYLGWQPWDSGDPAHPGQGEIIDAYQGIIRAQMEKQQLDLGQITPEDLTCYDPEKPLQRVLHIEKGHNTGGTKISSALVNHFLHCFTPSIVYTYAPGWKQIKNLLWKEILSDRKGSGLPGKTLSGALRIEITPEHFATGVATKGLDKESVQGQHQVFLMFILDEAEGMPDFVFEAIRTMASGGIAIIIMLANPRTRTSRFHREKSSPEAVALRMSCVNHPNVAQNQDVIHGAVTRQHVCNMIRDECRVVPQHSLDDFTFTMPFPVVYFTKDGTRVEHPVGTIWKPSGDFMYQVLGIPPAEGTGDVLVNIGRYEAAGRRQPGDLGTLVDDHTAYIGCDVARFGFDKGTFYSRYRGVLKRFAVVDDAITQDYVDLIMQEAKRLSDLGAVDLSIRVDGTGGFGSGVIDALNAREELFPMLGDQGFFNEVKIHEVHFGAKARDQKTYRNLITNIYGEVNETLLGTALVDVPPQLELDWCDRKYTWKNFQGIDVKALEDKEAFRKRHERSPDDGDGAALAMAPEHLFRKPRSRGRKATPLAR